MNNPTPRSPADKWAFWIAVVGGISAVAVAYITYSGKQGPQLETHSGYTIAVSDSNHKPIQNAKVSLTEDESAPTYGYTDSNGVVFEKLADGVKSIRVTIAAEGFVNQDFQTRPNGTGREEIIMTPLPAPATPAVLPQDPGLQSLRKRLANLHNEKMIVCNDGDPTHTNNTWYVYIFDYGRLGRLSIESAKFLDEHPAADPNGELVDQLQDTLAAIRNRDEQGTLLFDASGWHSKKLPDDFHDRLDSLRTLKLTTGVTADDVTQFESFIQGWYQSAQFPEKFDQLYQYCSATN